LPIAPTLAKVGGVGIAFLANFLMNTFIVFRADD
jgi:putative flippase GtrA